MLCEKCGKNNATTHIRTVINGVVRELDLCNNCAAEEGYNHLHHNSLAEMLASMMGETIKKRVTAEPVKCPVCKASFSDIAETGRMGCAECYNVFGNELLPYLKRVHGSTKHVGKVPNSAPLMVKPETDTVNELRLELNRLVREERYEEAAVVRDKIRKLEEDANE